MSNTGTYTLTVATALSTDTFASNNVLSETRFSNIPITTYPYTADFNTDNQGWVSRTTDATRLFIHDSIPYLSGAESHGKSWYLSASLQECCTDVWVESPNFNLNGLTNPILSMDIKYSLPFYYGYNNVTVQYSTNGGNNWTRTVLGSSADPQWYPSSSNYINDWGNGTVASWTNVEHSLAPVLNATCVKFRISTGSLYYAGDEFAFDNFKIQDALGDVGATQVSAPIASGCLYSASQQATINVYNYGAAGVTNIPVTLVITGAISKPDFNRHNCRPCTGSQLRQLYIPGNF